MEIVGLKTCVPDDVNKIIVKFLGYQTRTAKAINDKRCEYDEYEDDCYTFRQDERPEEPEENTFSWVFKIFKIHTESEKMHDRVEGSRQIKKH